MDDIASLARWAIRTALIAVGPWLAAHGVISAATVTEGADLITGGVLAGIGIVWSWRKYRGRKAAEAAAP